MNNTLTATEKERIQTAAGLNSEAKKLLRADTPKARMLAGQAHDLLHDCFDASAEATSCFAHTLLMLACCDSARNRYDDVIGRAGRALHLCETVGDEAGYSEALLVLAGAYGGKGDYATALEHLQRALALAGRRDDRTVMGMIQEDMGRYYWFLGDTKKALEYLYNSLAAAEEMGHSRGIALVLMDIGNVYANTGECPRAIECYLRGLSIVAGQQPQAWRERAGLLMNMAVAFGRMGDYDHALEYYLESLALQEETGTPVEVAILLGNIGELYREKGDYEQAEKYILRTLKVYEETDSQGERAFGLVSLALVRLQQGDAPQALQYAVTGLEVAGHTGEKQVQMLALHVMGQARMDMQDYEQAPDDLHRALLLGRELGDTEREMEIRLTMGTLLLRRRRFREALAHIREVLASAEKHAHTTLVMKAQKLLAEAHEHLGEAAAALEHFKTFYEMEKALFNERAEDKVQTLKILHEVREVQKEAEIYRLKNEQLKHDVDHMQQDLVMHALHLAQRTEALRKTRQELGRVDRSPQRSIRKGIRDVMKSLDDALADEGVWQMFEQQFRQVHSSFIDTLAKQYPDLSSTELKVCALIKIKMSSKEIGHILNISPRSVDTYRYRIRQKLGISSDTNLTQFMAEQE